VAPLRGDPAGSGDDDTALVDAILTLGDRLNNDIIAEGVETVQQRDWLVAHGCRYLQGHYFSKPLPQARFLELAVGRCDLAHRAARASCSD